MEDIKFGRCTLDLGETLALFAAGNANSRGGTRKLIATGYDAVLCLNGSLIWRVFHEDLIQKQGDFFLVPPGTYYEILGGERNPIFVHLRFVEKNKKQKEFNEFKLGVYSIECEVLCEMFLNVSREIVQISEVEDFKVTQDLLDKSKKLKMDLEEYFLKDHDCIEKKIATSTKSSEDIIRSVYSAVSENVDVTVDKISEITKVSPSYLARVFKEACGITPKQYINIYKINKSLEGLNKNKLDLSELSIDMGFTDQSHFTNVFKRFLMTTPGELKKKSLSS